LSARAAWRLETLGFANVFDYMPGKIDWLAYGLPVEGEQKTSPMLIARMKRDFPQCGLSDAVGEAKRRAEQLGFGICPVVNEKGIVFGLIREDTWKGDPAVPVGKIMESAPTTLRPSYSAETATEFLTTNGWNAVLVTSSDGKLLGIFERQGGEGKRHLS
jgi:CBS domain-containing protein